MPDLPHACSLKPVMMMWVGAAVHIMGQLQGRQAAQWSC